MAMAGATRARALRLPETVDENQVEAKFKTGALNAKLHKRPEIVREERKIQIKSS